MLSTAFFLAILATTGQASTIPAEPRHAAASATPIRAENVSVSDITDFIPAEHIVPADKLYDYLIANAGGNHSIWIPEENVSIDLKTLQAAVNTTTSASGNDKRQANCFGFIRQSVRQTDQFWDSWHPASGCYYTGLGSGGQAERSWSFTKTLEANFQVGNADALAGIISVALGFSVTRSWTNGGAFRCDIPANSVGQIWLQNYLGWAWIWAEECQSCAYGPTQCWNERALGGATAPRNSGQGGVGINLGCSTGWDHVSCNP